MTDDCAKCKEYVDICSGLFDCMVQFQETSDKKDELIRVLLNQMQILSKAFTTEIERVKDIRKKLEEQIEADKSKTAKEVLRGVRLIRIKKKENKNL